MNYYYYFAAASATTALAGLVHLFLAANTVSHLHYRFDNNIVLFLVGGITQIFWVMPVIRQRGKVWHSIGIAGTAFITIWAITRMPRNPIIAGRADDVAVIDLICEAAQIAYVGFTVVVIWSKKTTVSKSQQIGNACNTTVRNQRKLNFFQRI